MRFSKKFLGLTATCLLGSTAFASQTVQKDWTILVFLNGDNSLDSFGPFNLEQMEKVGSTDKVNVVVQWASESKKDTKRLFIQKENDTNNAVTSPVLQDMGTVDMGNVNNLVSFAQWGIQNYPAQHYMLDIWDHGDGFETRSLMPQIFRDVSWDDLSGNHITTEQLTSAVAQVKSTIGHNLDILGFDACLMAMEEIGAQVADSVDYLAGSEEEEPGDGWPYDTFLTAMNAPGADLSAIGVGTALTNTYAASYNGGAEGSEAVTFSLIDLAELQNSYTSLKNLGAALKNEVATNASAISAAVSNAQGFTVTDYRDVGDFLTQLQTRATGVSPELIADAQVHLAKVIVANADTQNFVGKAHGISVYATSDSSSWQTNGTRYQGFAFDQATNWSQWVQALVSAPK